MLLNCHTSFSIGYGTLSVEELLSNLQRHGYSVFALTDINSTSACLETLRLLSAELPEWKLRAVPGIDFRNGIKQNYVGLAANNQGFKELNDHLSEHLHQKKDFDERAPEFRHAFVIYPLQHYKGWALKEHEYIGVSVKDLKHLPFLPAKQQAHKLVILQSVSFAGKRQYNAHRLLRAVHLNTLLSKLPEEEQARMEEQIMPAEELRMAFAAWPGIISNTTRLLESCSVNFSFGKFANKNLKHYTGSAAGDMELLRQECKAGLLYRYPNPSREVMQRMEKELQVIEELNFASYFLINWDIVTYARHKDYYYVGRGSGANSILAYLLRITNVDPIQLDLYFERFINKFRSNAPDFDIDFSWTDRDDITAYIFKRFGNKRTALLGAYNTFQSDAVLRELGKVFGLPPAEIDKLQTPGQEGAPDHIGELIIKYSRLLHGLPSHLSIHSSGILISEEPIHAYSATFLPPKGYPTTQFSMLEAEDIGLYKFDILSQRGLGKIKDALHLVKENQGVEIDIHDVPKFIRDEKVRSLLREGKAIGCFYVESPAMRMLLKKLRADDYLRLVAASSIIRPGVSKSGMMREYIVRYRDEALRETARARLPELYYLLAETYGVMVYQEDVIRVAHEFAGLSLAEADYLRRGMSWKFKQRNEFWRVREQFFGNCKAKGYEAGLVQNIWEQIESFANFAFSKGHSASYAVESYQALYLKAHYPLEYMVATLNNGGGFYRTEVYVHEARQQGAEIKMPCVNRSAALCVIEGKTIYLGLGMVAELETQSIAAILKEREARGPFTSLEDFVQRLPLSLEQMRLLVRAGAFDFSGKNKKEMLWQMHALLSPIKKEKAPGLFELPAKSWQLPELSSCWIDEAFEQIGLLGFSLRSPFSLLKDPLPSALRSRDLRQHINGRVSMVGYLVTVKQARTSRGERMHFGTFLDLDGDWIDTVHFPPSAKSSPFTGPGCYLLEGRVSEEYDFVSLEVERMKRLPLLDRESARELVV